jgi:hypothetical protein
MALPIGFQEQWHACKLQSPMTRRIVALTLPREGNGQCFSTVLAYSVNTPAISWCTLGLKASPVARMLATSTGEASREHGVFEDGPRARPRLLSTSVMYTNPRGQSGTHARDRRLVWEVRGIRGASMSVATDQCKNAPHDILCGKIASLSSCQKRYADTVAMPRSKGVKAQQF